LAQPAISSQSTTALLGIHEYLLPSARLAVYFCPQQFDGNAIVKEVANSKKTTQEVADILGIDISALRRMMRQGKIAAPPILFEPKTNSTGRMWSEDDI
jgi:Helix-turn-helix domain